MDVRMPDGTVIQNVPEGTTKSELQRKLDAHKASRREAGMSAAKAAVEQSRASRQQEAPQGLNLRAPGPLGLALDLGSNMVRNTGATALSGLAGIASTVFDPGGDHARTVENVGSLAGEPLTPEGRAVSKVINYPLEKVAQFANWAGDEAAEGTGSPALGAALNTGLQAAPMLLFKGRGASASSRSVVPGKGGPSAKASASSRSAGLGSVPPTIEELAAQSKAAYKRASDAGVNIVPESFQNLKNQVNATLKKEGIDPTLHPGTTAALKRINETEGALSLDQLETLRKIANDARGGINKADSRMAGKIVDDLDDYIEGIGRKDISSGNPEGISALREARELYARKSRAEEIQRLIRRAEISAKRNFSASGLENALRSEFSALAKNDRKMRRFSPEERAAIEKVAKGGKLENLLRYIGKAAPTGIVSGTAGVVMTQALPGGIAIPLAGLAGRGLATRMTRANAMEAEAIMRRGRPQKPRAAIEEAELSAAKRYLESIAP